MKKCFSRFCFVILILLVCSHGLWAGGGGQASGTRATGPVNLALATSSSGSGPHTLGTTISNVLNSRQDAFRLTAQVSAGFNENMFLVAANEVAIGMITSYDLLQAYQEQGQFANNPQFKNLRRLTVYALEHGHQFVRADSGIRTMQDLVGRRLNVNVPATITSVRNRMILSAFGLSDSDFRIFEIATGGSFDAVRDRVVDASFNGLSIGNAALVELASSVPINLIGIPSAEFEIFNRLGGGTFAHGVIPANSYRGQTEDVPTWIGVNLLFTNANVDEEAIYQLIKAYWEGLEELARIDIGFQMVTRDLATFGPADVPLHPGAARYFREAGLLR